MSLGFKSGGNHCCAVECTHKSSKAPCTFYSFPTNLFLKKQWIVSINRAHLDQNGKASPGKLWEPKQHHRLCSCHFSTPPDPKARKVGWNHVKPDIFENRKQTTPRSTDRARNRYTQVELLKAIKTVDENHDKENTPSSAEEFPINGVSSSDFHHDHDYLHTERNGRIVKALDRLVNEHPELSSLLDDYEKAKTAEAQLQELQTKGAILSLDLIKHDNHLFTYYTGLPSYQVFKALFNYLQPKASDMQYVSQMGREHFSEHFSSKPGRRRVLSCEDEMFLTLVRLRLGVPSKDSARRFGIAESTFSNIFNTWCILLAQELERICTMPSGDIIQETRPPCFDNFSNVRIVLDCTELFSQTPGTLDNHKQQYSSYKHHSTVKFLVGMSPTGAIIYISEMWGGRASDKKITCESFQLLNSLDAGDKVMVDRGFTIEDLLPTGVKLIIPPFKNKTTGQFTAEQLEYSEKISVARIHVERAMRAIKEFRILESEVKLAMINNYENIFKACAYLVNFKRPFLKTQ